MSSAAAPETEPAGVTLSNPYESLDLLHDKMDNAAFLSSVNEAGRSEDLPSEIGHEAQPKKVFRVQLDEESDARFQYHCFCEQILALLPYIVGLWNEVEEGKTKAAVELIGEQEKALDFPASRISRTAEDGSRSSSSPLEAAILSLLDISSARKTNPHYVMSLEPLSNRSLGKFDASAVAADPALVRFMMDLDLEMGLKQDWEDKVKTSPKSDRVKPLHRSSCDIISRVLQNINDGAEVTLQAAFAATIFQSLEIV